MKPIEYYTYLYPQLTLIPKQGISKTEDYKNIVLRGTFPDNLSFPMETSGKEELINVETPIGSIECLYLPDREVFERFVTCLAYKCEPTVMPKTTGAIYISGLNCWRKILNHKQDYLKDHKEEEWDEEFDRFTSNKENYKGIVLLISKGYYSAVKPELVGIDEDIWINKSKDIRIYHELTHAISSKLYPDHKQAIRDEVIADSIGVLYAFKEYRKDIIKKCLGTEVDSYRFGGRLENYTDDPQEEYQYVNDLIEKIDEYISAYPGKKPFEYLTDIEDLYIK